MNVVMVIGPIEVLAISKLERTNTLMWLIKMSSSVRITVLLGAALLLCCSSVDRLLCHLL